MRATLQHWLVLLLLLVSRFLRSAPQEERAKGHTWEHLSEEKEVLAISVIYLQLCQGWAPSLDHSQNLSRTLCTNQQTTDLIDGSSLLNLSTLCALSAFSSADCVGSLFSSAYVHTADEAVPKSCLATTPPPPQSEAYCWLISFSLLAAGATYAQQ